ncbi:MAG: hypothetical protein QM539_00010 [Alphaproteobacteria bacterium]|nr:hypothetical protein [Alphaproteobacteria bacterium]
MWFYKQIYIYLTGDNNLTDSGFKNYIKFWELVSKQGIKVFISSTLLGWVAYNDCIPDYALSPMHKLANWKAGHGLNGSLFTGDVAFEILLTPSTIHHVYGYLDMRDFKKGQLNIKEPEINFSAGFVGLKERAEYFVNTIIPNAAERATYKTQKLDTTQNDYQDFELDL